ncbi:MAG: hypothetical protein EBS36_03650 [Actinobacteria bacterium]|nr:hypothetical protein [Actinomycetota bacterium]NBY16055.1 hypothetical protein [Actinomycetota bacterium]
MPKASIRNTRSLRLVLMGLIGASLMAVVGVGTFAGLNATASASHSASAGTLSLTSANRGVGFSQSVSNLAPGDVVNRYVNLTNGGSLDAKSLSLKITSTGTASLITNGVAPVTTKAVTVTVNSCTGTWTVATGVCSGTVQSEISATPLSTFATAQDFAANPTLASLAGLNLQIKVTLPDQDETTTDGTPPANTVQNGSVNLSYLFYEAQRTSTTTNS